jgi:hypothetical protein
VDSRVGCGGYPEESSSSPRSGSSFGRKRRPSSCVPTQTKQRKTCKWHRGPGRCPTNQRLRVAAPGRTEKCFTGEGDPFDTLGGTRRLLGGQCNCKSSKTAKSLKLGDPRTLHPVVGRYSVAAVHFYFGSECQ